MIPCSPLPEKPLVAGAYVATIGLSQRLFVAATGYASTAAIVLTTLLVASLFTPVKNQLQTLVNRYFGSADNPATKLRSFIEQMQSVLRFIDPRVIGTEQLTAHLLEEAVAAFDANSGAAFLKKGGQLQLVHIVGSWTGDTILRGSIEHSNTMYGVICLGTRRGGREYKRGEEAGRVPGSVVVSL